MSKDNKTQYNIAQESTIKPNTNTTQKGSTKQKTTHCYSTKQHKTTQPITARSFRNIARGKYMIHDQFLSMKRI